MSLNIRATVHEVGHPDELSTLRAHYLSSLPEVQDPLVELWVAEGRKLLLRVKGELVGYLVLHEQDLLIEFHLVPAYEIFAHILLPQLVRDLGLRAAYVKTFDHLFLSCALDIQKGVSMRGALVREIRMRELPDIGRIRYGQRTARSEDMPAILAVKQDVFTNPGRLRLAIERGWLQLFERDDVLLGLGLMRPILPGRLEMECGVAVDEAFRNKGYAIYMLRDLAQHCLNLGLKPVSGSSRANEASVRMGTRVGFLARYRMIEISFRDDRRET